MAVEQACRKSVAKAKHLDKIDKATIEALYAVARKVDLQDEMVADGRLDKPDNVSPETLRKYLNDLMLTPVSRSQEVSKKSEVKNGNLDKLKAKAKEVQGKKD